LLEKLIYLTIKFLDSVIWVGCQITPTDTFDKRISWVEGYQNLRGICSILKQITPLNCITYNVNLD